MADAPTECRLVVATYDGEWGPNPVRIARSLWPELPTDGDEGLARCYGGYETMSARWPA